MIKEIEVIFTRNRYGYQKDARRINVEVKKIELSDGVYEIYLGEIVDKSF